MRLLLFFTMFLMLSSVHSAADDAVRIANNFSVVIRSGAGHQTPVVNFFRELERTLRQIGRISPDTAGSELIVILHEDQKNSAGFVHSRSFRTRVLQLPANYRTLLDDPLLGRILVSALIQSRIGSKIWEPLSQHALWIADGVWAEFVNRQRYGNPIMRFVYLPAMRRIAEMGINPELSLPLLTLPIEVDLKSVQAEIYLQRARLMLETAQSLETRKSSNLIKDYLLLIRDGKLTPEQCFERTFAAAARNKFNNALELTPDRADTNSGYNALKYAALQTLFSQQAPMSPAAVERRFHAICQVIYTRAENGPQLKAHLTDLPQLVEKYETCGDLPLLKIWQLNMLSSAAPGQVRGEIFKLTEILSNISKVPTAKSAADLKNMISRLLSKLGSLQAVDSELARYEEKVMPLLYNQRVQLENPSKPAELPRKTGEFLDQAEKLRLQ